MKGEWPKKKEKKRSRYVNTENEREKKEETIKGTECRKKITVERKHTNKGKEKSEEKHLEVDVEF